MLRVPVSTARRVGRFFAVGCLGALSLAAVSQPASAQEHASGIFGKWHVFCSEALLCAAYTYAGTEGNPYSGHQFTLERSLGGDDWTMFLTLDGVEPKLSLLLQASVIRYGHDDVPIPHFQKEALVLYGGTTISGTAGQYTLYLSGASAEAVMARLRLGDTLDFEFGGCRDEFLFIGFSLDGITAALAWIDEKQGQPNGSNAVSQFTSEPGRPVSANCGE
jgi:hypothetical protein